MKIVWNKVTSLSQAVAMILFVAVFFVGFNVGKKYQTASILGEPLVTATYACDGGESITAQFFNSAAYVKLEGRGQYLVQTISASGARYANLDESFVFWNKGDEALIMRDNAMDLSYKNCKAQAPNKLPWE